jgi:hypothetical protein
MNQQNAEGKLAVIGTPRLMGEPTEGRSQVIKDYLVYPSLEERPRRTLGVEVRPPNGCYDVLVDLQPRAEGILLHQGRRYAVIGGRGAPFTWVVTQVRIVSRTIRGPYSQGVVC